MAKKFKWVRIPNMYGVRTWTGYELYVEGKPHRIALIERVKRGDYYSAIVDFDATGYNGTCLGYDHKKHTLTTFAYLNDCKKAVEKHYGLK